MSTDKNYSAIRQAELTGGVLLPTLASLIYGISRLVRYGFADELAVFLVVGSVAAALFGVWYVSAAINPSKKVWVRSLAAFSGGVPFGFALSLIAYLGIWNAVRAVLNYTGILPFLWAALWALIGYRELSILAKIRALLTYDRS